MHSARTVQSLDEAASILRVLREKGVRLWVEAGELKYRARRGSLTAQEVERLAASRRDILALLEGPGAAAPRHQESHSERFARAPLTYTQLWHWRRLKNRTSYRHIASATRLLGEVDADALQRSLAATVSRHDALRTKIEIFDGSPIQRIEPVARCVLDIHDLTGLPVGKRSAAARQLIEQSILQPIDIVMDPLFAVSLIKLGSVEHVLVVTMDHIIADVYSLGIFARDLAAFYDLARGGPERSLPGISVQFPEYATWQKAVGKPWLEEHAAYWNARLEGCGRLTFPGDKEPGVSEASWAAVSFRIEESLKRRLHEWARNQRTTIVMSVLSAYVVLVMRWCRATDVVIRYQTDGRANSKTAHTIGYFACALHLRIELSDADTFVDLLHRVTREYCNAGQHADLSYFDSLQPAPDFTLNTMFNWIQRGPEFGGRSMLGVDAVPFDFENPALKRPRSDREPITLFYENDDAVVGQVHFSADRFSICNMQKFGQTLLALLEAMLDRPAARITDLLRE